VDSDASSRRVWRWAAPLVFAACGVLLITSARAADGNDLRGSESAELTDLVRAQERRATELEADLEGITAEVEELRGQLGALEPGEGGATGGGMAQAAGFTPVEGPGVTVTLDDATMPHEPSDVDGSVTEAYIVHQQDMEGVMNARWAGGGEAMAVMDHRVISSSTVKCVGPVVLVDGRQYAPPYTVTAIGDPDELLAALDASPQVQEYRHFADEIGLGYDVEVHDSVELPAYEGSLSPGEEDVP